jgi:hypothetical protein
VFKSFREPKLPTLDDAAKHTIEEWQALERKALDKLRKAETGRARQHQVDRIAYCQVAALKRGEQ